MLKPTPGKLRHRADVRRWEEFPDPADDGTVENYPLVAGGVWMLFEAVGGHLYRQGVQTGEKVTHRVYMRHRTGIDASTVLVWKGRRFLVRRVVDLDDRERYLSLEVEEEGPHGT